MNNGISKKRFLRNHRSNKNDKDDMQNEWFRLLDQKILSRNHHENSINTIIDNIKTITGNFTHLQQNNLE